jgi:hypothetical protein
MNKDCRIGLNDTLMDVFVKMSDGNPGALTVMSQLYQDVPTIDPMNIMGGLGAIMELDSLGIYGPRIWMLYKDVCGQDVEKTNWMIRAVQLGVISESDINHRIDNHGRDGIDEIIDKVLKELKQE